jgi:hypothetical protein
MGDVDMNLPHHLVALKTFVDAYENPTHLAGGRQPLYYFRTQRGSQLQHPGLPDMALEFEQAALEEMESMGIIDIDYSGDVWQVTPAPLGRSLLEQSERLAVTDPVADTATFLTAVQEQFAADNKLSWPAVRPVLAALRRYWENGGFSPHGVALRALIQALPEEHMPMFVATIESLIASEYLTEGSDLVVAGVVAEVGFTQHAFAVLDGWPGAAPDELVRNLLAILDAAAVHEPDPVRKRLLGRTGESVRELGVATFSEVLAKVITGGT